MTRRALARRRQAIVERNSFRSTEARDRKLFHASCLSKNDLPKSQGLLPYKSVVFFSLTIPISRTFLTFSRVATLPFLLTRNPTLTPALARTSRHAAGTSGPLAKAQSSPRARSAFRHGRCDHGTARREVAHSFLPADHNHPSNHRKPKTGLVSAKLPDPRGASPWKRGRRDPSLTNRVRPSPAS